MQPFIHIESPVKVAGLVYRDPNMVTGPVQYRGTTKLHGTNAGIGCFPDRLVAQSRSQVITPERDNAGFAQFVVDQADQIREIEARIRADHKVAATDAVYLYGEWCGPGVQKGVGINKLSSRQLVLFAVKVVGEGRDEYIDALFPLNAEFDRIHSILDIPVWELTIDFFDRKSKQEAIELAYSLTQQVEDECPWAKRFGVSGTGEGIVWVPVGKDWGKTDLVFKTKGNKHNGTESKRTKPSMDPEVLQSIEEFLNFSTTEARLNQGLDVMKEKGISLEMPNVGHFLKWVSEDVLRECSEELAASGLLEWKKQVAPRVIERARNFFKKALDSTI